MRIAIITTGFSKDEKDFGGASAIHNFVKNLSIKQGMDITIFTLYYPPDKHEYNFYNAKVFSFAERKQGKIGKIKIWKKCRRKFVEEHNKNNFNLIHALWCGESGYVASQLSREYGIPLAATICGGELAGIKNIDYGSQLKFWQRYFVEKTFKQAKEIVAGSKYIIDKIRVYRAGKYKSKARKIPFGADEKFLKQDLTLISSLVRKGESGLFRIISIANAVPVKSHTDLFKAFKIVLQKFPDAKLICCGRDEKDALKKAVHVLNIETNVELKGFIDYEHIPYMINTSDIFVLSSLYESQNIAIIEAAFCGVPIVSTNVGIAEEITPYIVEPGNYKQMAEKILYVISNYEKVKKESETNTQIILEKYSAENCAGKYIELYKEILNIDG